MVAGIAVNSPWVLSIYQAMCWGLHMHKELKWLSQRHKLTIIHTLLLRATVLKTILGLAPVILWNRYFHYFWQHRDLERSDCWDHHLQLVRAWSQPCGNLKAMFLALPFHWFPKFTVSRYYWARFQAQFVWLQSSQVFHFTNFWDWGVNTGSSRETERCLYRDKKHFCTAGPDFVKHTSVAPSSQPPPGCAVFSETTYQVPWGRVMLSPPDLACLPVVLPGLASAWLLGTSCHLPRV